MNRDKDIVRYPRHFTKSFAKLTMTQHQNLRYRYRMVDEDIKSGMTEVDAINKLAMSMYLPLWCFTYWGGTKVLRVDKEDEYGQSEDSWIAKIRSVYENITEKTNRKMFGRRYLLKVLYPTSFVFYEKGDITEGKHIHTLHSFPSGVIDKANDYLGLFTKYWNSHYVNRDVGRCFWYEEVDNQEDASRYATKRMTENGWFVVS